MSFAGGSHQATWSLTSGNQHERMALQARMKANNVFAVRDAAMAGLGIAQLPLIFAQQAVETGQLCQVLK